MLFELLLCSACAVQEPSVSPLVLEDLAGVRTQHAVADVDLALWNDSAAWLRLPARAQLDDPARAEVRLRGGDRMYGALRGGAKENLLLGLPGGAPLALPLEELESLVVTSRVPSGRSTELQPPAHGDRLLRALGGGLDRIDGTLVGFSNDGVQFETSAGARTYAWTEVAALYVEALESRAPALGGGASVSVDLCGGGQLHGTLRELDGSGIALRRAAGPELRLPWSALVGLARDDGRFAWVSALPRASEEPCRPFGDDLGMVWHALADRCAAGGPLLAEGEAVARGIGMHAPARLGVDLDRRYKTLRGRVAIDESVRGLPAAGSVVFEVLGDGKSLWRSQVVRGVVAPLELPALAVSGVKTLELVVDSADGGFAGDRANWLELRVSER
jgi:hypothetical protein